MALDGMFLHALLHEIEAKALGARVDKVAQPTREEVILHLRWRGGSGKLLLSAGADSPRIHFTEEAPENPKAPPMFCMLMRKHLGGGRLVAVRQQGLDRIVFLDFEVFNELGDLVTATLAMEIMGRHSNIMLLDDKGKVVDAVKRVDVSTSSVRQILPGMQYALPPQQDKLNLLESTPQQAMEYLAQQKDGELSKVLMGALQGVSPLLCREVAHFALKGEEHPFSQLSPEQKDRLRFYLDTLQQTLVNHNEKPVMLLEPQGKPRDFSFVPIRQYGTAYLTKDFETFGGMLDRFYQERDRIDRMKQRSGGLFKMLLSRMERISRRLAAQQEELRECADRERYKICGDLIGANLYSLKKGDTKAVVSDFYQESAPTVEIELDVRLTPAQNAQKYYARYRKADTAEKILREQIQQGEEELAYIESVFDALSRSATEAELDEIRRELHAEGYVRASGKRGQKQPPKSLPMRYRSSQGFVILAGRNNLQNDRLTLKEARGNDLWLHTQKIPGSHVIVLSDGKEIPPATIEEAAMIAVHNSNARDSSKVPVDYAFVRYVKKPSGAKPGKVIYEQFQTAYITPDSELLRRLEE